MKISLAELRRLAPTRVIIESVDLSLYIAHAFVDGEQCLIVDASGKVLKTRNLLDMKAHLAALKTAELVLRQRSAYDEMVGQSWDTADNTLELPVSADAQPLPDWLH